MSEAPIDAVDSVPPRVREIAERLRRDPNVVGVFWGHPRRGGRWRTDELCICIHVRKKVKQRRGLRSRGIPKWIEGYRTDVMQVGVVRVQSFSVESMLMNGNLASSLTVVGTAGDHAIALSSGHGTRAGDVVRLTDTHGNKLVGRVVARRFAAGEPVDWALLQFDDAASSVSTYHPLCGRDAPQRLRTERIQMAEHLKHYSSQDEVERTGTVVQVTAGEMEFNIDGDWVLYADLLVIAPRDGEDWFSRGGDSGSLIVDDSPHGRRAVAAVVGGPLTRAVTYAYELARLPNYIERQILKRFLEA